MAKRRKLNAKPPNHQNHQRQRRQIEQPQKKPQRQQQQQQQRPQKQQQRRQQRQPPERPTIPFDPDDRILLIGEGDLSYAASLVRHHGCSNLVATVLEKSHAELVDKYPQAAANVEAITNPPPPPTGPSSSPPSPGPGIDPRADDQGGGGGDEDWEWDGQDGQEATPDGDGDGDDEDERHPRPAANSHPPTRPCRNKVVYGVDATRPLPASVARPPPNRIIFNFPHVGGKSTDVNRQVRHNQALLVSFFTRAALPALAPRGTLVVTLFEAEPYTLWNVRDLARHAGLGVVRSFRFHWAPYPGYHHARTLGVVRGRDGASASAAAWKGEDRPARSYVFARKDETPLLPRSAAATAHGSKKRRADDSDDSDDDDDDDDD